MSIKLSPYEEIRVEPSPESSMFVAAIERAILDLALTGEGAVSESKKMNTTNKNSAIRWIRGMNPNALVSFQEACELAGLDHKAIIAGLERNKLLPKTKHKH